MTKTVRPQQLAATVKADVNRWWTGKRPELARALYASGLSLEAHAKRKCPVRTGTLRASLHTVSIAWNIVEVRDGVAYGVWVEFGTSRMEAQPYMRPAVYSSEPERMDLMAEALNGS
jgi:hypothetical protein